MNLGAKSLIGLTFAELYKAKVAGGDPFALSTYLATTGVVTASVAAMNNVFNGLVNAASRIAFPNAPVHGRRVAPFIPSLSFLGTPLDRLALNTGMSRINKPFVRAATRTPSFTR